MITKEISNINRIIENLQSMKDVQELRAKELKTCESACLNYRLGCNDKPYYYRRDRRANKSVYLGSESCEDVKLIKEYRYLQKSLEVIGQDIQCLEAAARDLRDVDYDSINASLPKLYRGAEISGVMSKNAAAKKWKEEAEAHKSRFKPYRPEELKVPTLDGSFVRSKSEALIYNHLLLQGITFVYELPTRVGSSTFWPDFTILSENDYKTEILLEHQGMMNTQFYRDRFFEKQYEYWKAGYIQGINIFYTFDDPRGALSLAPIDDMIRNVVRCDMHS